jgi:hypothetical protein
MSQARMRMRRERGLQRRGGAADWLSVLSCPFSVLSFVERTVGVKSFAGTFFEKNFSIAEQAVDFVSFSDGNEEDLAFAFAPDVPEILRGEKDWRGVGEGAAEEH